ncbi:MAG: ATP-dependent helicase [Actinomycetaceae bacterium]|nr:ATP-dependent helicase [Actinomycetaceae bacterium]
MASPEQILEDLDPEQREVACTLQGPVCVRAGAGTGKTRAITYRTAYGIQSGIYDPKHVLVLTFTNRAAAELRGRLRLLGVPSVQARTFHAAALSQLKYFWPQAVGGQCPPIEAHARALVAEAASRLSLPYEEAIIEDLLREIEWAKVSLIDSQSYVQRAENAGRPEILGCAPEGIARLIEVYEDVKIERGVLDFNDVLLLLLGILIDRPDIAREVRAQYKRFVVDEYQDVSPLQHRLLREWLGTSQELCVVGDASQTIYSFTGADSSYLTGFTKEFPRARVIDLVRDYRSSPQIVEYANKVMKHAPASSSRESALTLVSQNPPAAPVDYREFSSQVEEAEAIADEIVRLRERGKDLGDIAILYRTNAQSQLFEQALTEREIPFYVGGAESFFSRREVLQAMVRLRAAGREGASGGLVVNVQTVLAGVGWSEKPPATSGEAREKWECLTSLVELASEMSQDDPQASMLDFVRELERRASEGFSPKMHTVTLSSLHGAKGLEWDTVFLAAVNDGLLPISYASTREAIEEERRLFYVGVTRAKTALYVSSSAPSHGAPVRPSPFLP